MRIIPKTACVLQGERADMLGASFDAYLADAVHARQVGRGHSDCAERLNRRLSPPLPITLPGHLRREYSL